MLRALIYSTIIILFFPGTSVSSMTGPIDRAPPVWSARLDSDLRFYQTTELGALIAGTAVAPQECAPG